QGIGWVGVGSWPHPTGSIRRGTERWRVAGGGGGGGGGRGAPCPLSPPPLWPLGLSPLSPPAGLSHSPPPPPPPPPPRPPPPPPAGRAANPAYRSDRRAPMRPAPKTASGGRSDGPRWRRDGRHRCLIHMRDHVHRTRGRRGGPLDRAAVHNPIVVINFGNGF